VHLNAASKAAAILSPEYTRLHFSVIIIRLVTIRGNRRMLQIFTSLMLISFALSSRYRRDCCFNGCRKREGAGT
jgi:hypothetical protein